MSKWLLLVYKVPRQPTAGRVYVWRKLKQLGALPLQDAVWVLPATPRTQEQLQWLASEVAELQGTATLWSADSVFDRQTKTVVEQFTTQVDHEYKAILTGLKRKGADLKALAQRYQQAQSRDFFQSSLGRRVRQQLLRARGGQS